MRDQRRRVDWTPTFGIAIAALTAYLVYTSLRLDRITQRYGNDQAVQKRNDDEAAKSRADIAVKSDRRNKQLGTAIAVVAAVAVVAQIKGFPWI